MSDWNPQNYLKFKKERTQPSIDLLNRITFDSPKNIIDIGCGPGNSTAVLKERYPNANIIGADFSPNMIEKAKKDYPNIDFILFDATKDFEKLTEKFDIVFSNACIQWVPNHNVLLKNMMSVLNPGGVLAVQEPNQSEMPVNHIVGNIVKSDKWKNKFCNKRNFYNLTEEEYFNLLSDISSDFSMWKTVYFHRLPSQESIVEWYRSTGLRPYLEELDDADKNEFEQDVLEKLKEEYPTQKNGEVIFRFSRLFFTAIK